MYRDAFRGRGRGRKCISGPVMEKNDESFRTVLEEMQNLGFSGQGYIFDAIENFDDMNTFGNNIHGSFYENREEVEEEQMRNKKAEQNVKCPSKKKEDAVSSIGVVTHKPRGRKPKKALIQEEEKGSAGAKIERGEGNFFSVMRLANKNGNENLNNTTCIPFGTVNGMPQLPIKRKRGRPRKDEVLQKALLLMSTQRKRGRPRKDASAVMLSGGMKEVSKTNVKKKTVFSPNVNMRLFADDAAPSSILMQGQNIEGICDTSNNFYENQNVNMPAYSTQQIPVQKNSNKRIKPTEILPAALAFASTPSLAQIPVFQKRKKGRPRKYF